MEPDQIDMMDEHELRGEIRKLIARHSPCTVDSLVQHPSGFDSWQDLRGYLLDYNIIGHDDETCRLIEEAYNHWPNKETK